MSSCIVPIYSPLMLVDWVLDSIEATAQCVILRSGYLSNFRSTSQVVCTRWTTAVVDLRKLPSNFLSVRDYPLQDRIYFRLAFPTKCVFGLIYSFFLLELGINTRYTIRYTFWAPSPDSLAFDFRIEWSLLLNFIFSLTVWKTDSYVIKISLQIKPNVYSLWFI